MRSVFAIAVSALLQVCVVFSSEQADVAVKPFSISASRNGNLGIVGKSNKGEEAEQTERRPHLASRLGSDLKNKALGGSDKTKSSSGTGLFGKFRTGSRGKGKNAPVGPAVAIAASCCSQLSQAFVGQVNTPQDVSSYRQELNSYWATQNREVRPSCFVLPNSAEDVSKILRIINAANEQQPNNCQFAVRSGGHTPIDRWNNIEGGVTIDLSNIHQVQIANDRQTVAIGPGNRWGDVYSRLDANNLATTGGRVASVGVGGLLTGGGISFFTPRYGLSCDNVRNFQVVLADGSIVNANNTSNSDLFRALKGGSSNFGIVTRFDMATFDQGQFYGGLAFLKANARADVFDWLEEYPRINDVYAHVILSFSFAQVLGITVPVATANFQYTQRNTKPAVFQPLLSAASYNTGRISSHTDFANEIKNLNPDGHRQLFLSFSHQNSASFMERVYDISQSHFNRIKSTVPGIQWSTSYQPLSSKTLAKSAQFGGNALGLENAPDTVLVLLTVTWSNTASDKTVEIAARNLYNDVESAAKSAGKFSRFVYLNYAAEFQDPLARYGPESLSRLTTVAEKYDPKGVFQTNMPGGFKLHSRSSAAAEAQTSSWPPSLSQSSPKGKGRPGQGDRGPKGSSDSDESQLPYAPPWEKHGGPETDDHEDVEGFEDYDRDDQDEERRLPKRKNW